MNIQSYRSKSLLLLNNKIVFFSKFKIYGIVYLFKYTNVNEYVNKPKILLSGDFLCVLLLQQMYRRIV